MGLQTWSKLALTGVDRVCHPVDKDYILFASRGQTTLANAVMEGLTLSSYCCCRTLPFMAFKQGWCRRGHSFLVYSVPVRSALFCPGHYHTCLDPQARRAGRCCRPRSVAVGSSALGRRPSHAVVTLHDCYARIPAQISGRALLAASAGTLVLPRITSSVHHSSRV